MAMVVILSLAFPCVFGGELDHCSPGAMVADGSGRNMYIADETGSRIVHLDLKEENVLREFRLPTPPTGLVLNRAGDRLYVTTGGPEGNVLVLDLVLARVRSSLRTGHSPTAPVLNQDETVLYVCNRFDDSLSVMDLRSGEELKRLPMAREPVAAALAPNGKVLAVANHGTYDSAGEPVVACRVNLIETGSNELVATVGLPHGSLGLRGICISPDSRLAFVSHNLARNHVPATQLENGWLNTNGLSVIDLEQEEHLGTVILDEVGRGAANPWGIACTTDGKTLCVALAGVHQLSVLDLPELLKRIQDFHPTRDPSGYAETTYSSLGFLQGIHRRIQLRGKGPRSVLVTGSEVYIGMHFSGGLESIELNDPGKVPGTIPLGPVMEPGETRRGEILFNDATICFQGWQSCATCHPGGRSDGLNWDLTNDGIGNTKNSRSLLFAHQTAPLTMSGMFESLDECVRFEIKTILFSQIPDGDAAAIVAYLKSLEPLGSPHLERGELTASARRGKEVFRKARCHGCHRGEYFTSLTLKNVGTRVPGDQRSEFVVPGLNEVWRTAPYLHHGQAASVEEVLSRFNLKDRHGETSGLSQKEMADLINYVLSL